MQSRKNSEEYRGHPEGTGEQGGGSRAERLDSIVGNAIVFQERVGWFSPTGA